jgi:hypothetical protein
MDDRSACSILKSDLNRYKETNELVSLFSSSKDTSILLPLPFSFDSDRSLPFVGFVSGERPKDNDKVFLFFFPVFVNYYCILFSLCAFLARDILR